METRFFATGNYRKDGRTETAHAMKDGEHWAIGKAAAEMARYIPTNAALVPMPSHTGAATYTLQLCKRIARETGAIVCDILKGQPRETLYNLKKQGHHIRPSKLGFYVTAPAPEGKRLLIIDNVVATGTTAAAAVEAVGRGIVFAYAAATNSNTLPQLTRVETPKL